MSNELLNAIKEYKVNLNPTPIYKYLHSFISDPVTKNNKDFLSDIEALLALQRQECAEKAEARVHKDMKFIEIDKQSILNAKLF